MYYYKRLFCLSVLSSFWNHTETINVLKIKSFLFQDLVLVCLAITVLDYR